MRVGSSGEQLSGTRSGEVVKTAKSCPGDLALRDPWQPKRVIYECGVEVDDRL
jgi:hypothetical protein